MKRRIALYTLSTILLLLMEGSVSGQSDDRTRVFNAPVDRVWVVASSTLKSLGWSVDKEDRDVGWIRTDSRRLEGGDYGVYSKGAKHRLRVVIKAQDGSRTAVTVERRVWKEERILWMDKEEELPTTDHSVETQLLDAVGKSL
jgi:hypothetical protein